MPSRPTPPPARTPRGGGAPFILLLIAGIVGGVVLGQPTIGFLVGAAAGTAAAVAIWLRDRRR